MKQFRYVWFYNNKKIEGDWNNLSDYNLDNMLFNAQYLEPYGNWYIEYRG